MGEEEGKGDALLDKKRSMKNSAEEMMDRPFLITHLKCFVIGAESVKEELLALTPEDFDFEAKTVRINKTYHKIEGRRCG